MADELLGDTVLAVLTGAPSIGGYARFVRFVYSKLGTTVKFDKDGLQDASARISAIMKQRGHSPICMPHGQCMAGSTRSVHLARCSKPENKSISREFASAKTCATCAYHYSNAAYIVNLKQDLVYLERTCAGKDSVERKIAERSACDLRRIIALHEAKFMEAER